MMTPTHYPGWRIFGLVLAVNNTVWAALSISMVLSPHDASVLTAGWVTQHTAAVSPAFLTFICCLGLTIAGAAMSVKRPAWGFLILGAGYLASAMSIAVLYRYPTSAGGCLFLGGSGVLYSCLGVNQRAKDRAS